jgi:sugar lactone lactonase YvrE
MLRFRIHTRRVAILAAGCTAALLSACGTVLHVVTQAGGEGLSWPLPPAAARLHYEGAFDVAQGAAPPMRVITGVDAPSLTQVPLRVAARDTLLALVERERGSVQVHDRAHSRSFLLKAESGAPLVGARDVAIDDFQRLYVIEGGAGRIGVYDASGKRLRRFGSDHVWRRPARLALDTLRDRLYVADDFLDQVLVFSLNGAYLFTIGEHGWEPGRFNGLADLTVDAAGHLVTVETTAHRVQRFTPEGRWQRVLTPASGPQAPVEPVAVAVEEDGTLYVADRYREQLLVYDADGQPLLALGGLGREPARFSGLVDLELDPRARRLYTCETAFPRVQVFRRSEQPWRPYP